MKELVIKLECTTNGSNKFYNIKIKSRLNDGMLYYDIYTAYGKIGTSDKYNEVLLTSNGLIEIDNFICSIIKSKRKKGYILLNSYNYQILQEEFYGKVSLTKPIIFIDEVYSIKSEDIILNTADDINKNIIKAAQIKKDNKFKEEVKHWFYSLESIRDLI